MPTHQRLLGCLDAAELPPMQLHGASVFHLGGHSREVEGGFELLYLNPTTSTRFNPYMPRLIRGCDWHAVGGKGGLGQASADALQEVGWSDMLVHYRLVRLKVQGLGRDGGHRCAWPQPVCRR